MSVYTDFYGAVYGPVYGQLAGAFPGGGPIDIRADIYLGTWTDFSPYIYQRDNINITYGRQNQSSTLSPAIWTATLNNRDNRWTIRNPTGPWYGLIKQNSPIRFSIPSYVRGIPSYLRFETDNLSYAYTPDSAPLQITSGTLSVRADVKPTDGFNAAFAGKWGSTGKSWVFAQNDNGTLVLFHWDGSNQFGESSSIVVPTFGQRIAARVDYNIASKTLTYYTAPTMAGPWVQLGAVINTTATALSGAAGQIVQVGAVNATGLFGEVYEVQIYSTASLVADPIFTAEPTGTTSFTDAQSNNWFLSGTAEITDRSYRFHGELASLPKQADATQSDVYSTATAGGLTRRLQQAQTPADSPMKRAWVRYTAEPAINYWPLEDLAQANSFASAVGGPPMTWGTKPQLSSNTSFVSSAALPVLNGMAVSGAMPGYVATDDVVGVMIAIPSGGDTNNGNLIRYFTNGTIARVDVSYQNAGGTINLSAYDDGDAQIFNTFETIQLNGTPRLMFFSMVQSSPGTVTWHIDSMAPGQSNAGLSGTVPGTQTIGSVINVILNPGGLLNATAFGHCVVQAKYNSGHLGTLTNPLNAWFGETAGFRFARLASEEGYKYRVVGPQALSEQMGFQTQETIFSLLQECETTDQGFMYEPRQALSLGYVTRYALYNQTPVVTADFSQATILPDFSPTSDDQLVINDVTFSNANGSSARVFLAAGNMSVLAPPNGIGRFDTSVTVNTATDAALPSGAQWFLHVRSVDEDRYPNIPFQMARVITPSSAAELDVGKVIQITNPSAWIPTGPIRQIVPGYTETFNPQPLWSINFNGIPESPYEVMVANQDRLDAANSTLATTLDTVQTSFVTAGTSIWNVSLDLPYDIVIAGERMTITSGSPVGATPQTIHVTRSVNGVVKSHAVGEQIHLWRPAVLAR